MGKWVNILVIDGLDGLEIFGIVFLVVRLLGFDRISGRGLAVKDHDEG